MILAAAILSLYEMLWLQIEKEHADVYAKYDLINEGEHRVGAEAADHVANHVLVADFDGDGKSDYALVLVPREGTGYAILVLLGFGKQEEAILVIDRAEGRRRPSRSEGRTHLSQAAARRSLSRQAAGGQGGFSG